MLIRRVLTKRFIVFLLNMLLLSTISSTPSIGKVFSLKDINGDDVKFLNPCDDTTECRFADSKKEALFQIGKNVIPLRSGLFINNQGNIHRGTLMRDTELIVGNKSVIAPGGCEIIFHDDGNVEMCGLLRETEFIVGDRSIIFKGGCNFKNHQQLVFYSNGNLSSGLFAKETFFRVGKYQFGAIQGHFSEDGQIIMADFDIKLFETEIGGNKYCFKSIGFSDSKTFNSTMGMVRYGFRVRYGYKNESVFLSDGWLGREAVSKIGSNTILFNGYLEFYPTGVVKSGRLSEDSTLKVGKREMTLAATALLFFPDGTIRKGFLKNSTVVTIGDRNYKFRAIWREKYSYGVPPRNAIWFHKNGNVHQAVLDEDIVYDEGPSKGQVLKAGTDLEFDENENLLL